MTHIAIIYYSGSGHTEAQAHAVTEGVSSVNQVQAICYSIDKLTKNHAELVTADAIIFGAPTYMGSVAAPFKSFMDSTSQIWSNQGWKNKIAAGFTNSLSLSGDKLNTLIQMVIFATQHGMIWVGQSELNQSPKNYPGAPQSINRMGAYLGAMAQSENDSPLVTPPEGDLATARKLGARVALITQMLQRSECNVYSEIR